MASHSIKVRVLSCPNCGAKLRWNRDAPIIECRYCHVHVIVETGQVTTQPTDVMSTAAPQAWKVVAIVGALALVGGGISAALSSRAGGPRGTGQTAKRTSTVAQLVATPLAATPAEVASLHGVRALGTSVFVVLSDGPFSEASFHWNSKDHPDHVTNVRLKPRDPKAAQDDVVARARTQLGRALRESSSGGYEFSAKAVFFSISGDVTIFAGQLDSPGWKERLGLMWSVMKHAAFGTDDRIDDRARRDLLNLGYPLTVLLEIDFDTIVDDAEREVHRVAPGAESEGERHTIGLDHPWFESAWLKWNNAPGGKWTSITMYFPKELDFKAEHEAMAACISPLLGEPKRIVQDHLAGTFWLQFRARGGVPWVDLGYKTFSTYLRYQFGEPATAAGFHSLIRALAACDPS